MKKHRVTDPDVTDTVVIKITPDAAGEPPSAMRVVGARDRFVYGAHAGASAHFDARLWHRSEWPESLRPHMKVSLFCKPGADTAPVGRLRKKLFDDPPC